MIKLFIEYSFLLAIDELRRHNIEKISLGEMPELMSIIHIITHYKNNFLDIKLTPIEWESNPFVKKIFKENPPGVITFDINKPEKNAVYFTTKLNAEEAKVLSIKQQCMIISIENYQEIFKYTLTKTIYIDNEFKSKGNPLNFFIFDLKIQDPYFLADNRIYKKQVEFIKSVFPIDNTFSIHTYTNQSPNKHKNNRLTPDENDITNFKNYIPNSIKNKEVKIVEKFHNRNIISNYFIASSEFGFNLATYKEELRPSLLICIPCFTYDPHQRYFIFETTKKNIEKQII